MQIEFILSYKQARRRDDNIAIVNAGLRVKLYPAEPHWAVEECAISYGGMSFRTIMAQNAQKMLLGNFVQLFFCLMCRLLVHYCRQWNEAMLNEVCSLLLEELSLPPNVPGGMPEYRQSLVTSFFFKFYLLVSCLPSGGSPCLRSLLVRHSCTTGKWQRACAQGFRSVPEAQINYDFVGRPMMHLSALKQASGEAR